MATAKKLVILDIKGILGIEVEKGNTVRQGTLKLASYDFLPRPEVATFLSNLYKDYEVAFFSSTTEKNAFLILKEILTRDQMKKTLFFWYRDRTHLDPNPGALPYETVKLLDDVFTSPIVNKERKWSKNNTILVDDSAVKTRFNDDANLIILPTYDPEVADNLLEVLNSLKENFMKLELQSMSIKD